MSLLSSTFPLVSCPDIESCFHPYCSCLDSPIRSAATLHSPQASAGSFCCHATTRMLFFLVQLFFPDPGIGPSPAPEVVVISRLFQPATKSRLAVNFQRSDALVDPGAPMAICAKPPRTCLVPCINFEVQLYIVADSIILKGELVFERPLSLSFEQNLMRRTTDVSTDDLLELADRI
jgi:hypothetical protein